MYLGERSSYHHIRRPVSYCMLLTHYQSPYKFCWEGYTYNYCSILVLLDMVLKPCGFFLQKLLREELGRINLKSFGFRGE